MCQHFKHISKLCERTLLCTYRQCWARVLSHPSICSGIYLKVHIYMEIQYTRQSLTGRTRLREGQPFAVTGWVERRKDGCCGGLLYLVISGSCDAKLRTNLNKPAMRMFRIWKISMYVTPINGTQDLYPAGFFLISFCLVIVRVYHN